MKKLAIGIEAPVGWPLDPTEGNGEHAERIGSGHTARADLQRALLAEIEWVSRTVTQLDALGERTRELAGTPEWRERVERVLTDVGQPKPDEERYQTVVHTLVLASIASDADGRLATTVYDGSVERIGLLTSGGARALVDFYATVGLLREQLRRFDADVAANGVGPRESFEPVTAIRRAATIEAIDRYAAALADTKEGTIDAILEA